MTKELILDYLKTHKPFLQEQFNVKKIGLFGSYAKEQQTPQSDIDIIVDMPSSFDNYYALKELLEKELGAKVDLGLEKSIRNLIKEKIAREVLYV
ncbi:nucleotidyltransferase family protein [Sulfurospirillum sp. hDNRA2]|uniref:nucleotidyltransferase family protein n=1 Tax=Sulfurospirillum sp. hDNRA2 TaxID=3237298 RepID=UPI0020B88F23|nr:nucleotidyltransferase family protein [Sulfurospirillum sp. DNRA8]MCD8543489.1 nucleotidyltransferase family protein [Sulfurospirillum cavolei]MCP3652174.1 nucleotidyltransferase family protein [Sulfurospirillum sp. DNRA8]MCR1811024.1 nucleotidyltransferase family protein [Sulfurospirillum sp. DNRA8]